MNKILYSILITLSCIIIIADHVLLYIFYIIAINETSFTKSKNLCYKSNICYYLIYNIISFTLFTIILILMIFIEYFKLNYIYIYYSIISNLTSIILWGFIELFAYDCINKLKNTKIYQYSFILWIISIILLILLLSLLLLLFIIKQYQIVSNNLNYIRNNIINYNNEIESENDSEYEFQ